MGQPDPWTTLRYTNRLGPGNIRAVRNVAPAVRKHAGVRPASVNQRADVARAVRDHGPYVYKRAAVNRRLTGR